MDRPHHLGQPVITFAAATAEDIAIWKAMRDTLWPQDEATQFAEIRELFGRTDQRALIACVNGNAAGFAEVSVRRDFVNGCDTSPVAFLEGIYVMPQMRRRGVARALVAAARDWAVAQGCSELASDALADNRVSHQMHAALGFEETERVVFFRQKL